MFFRPTSQGATGTHNRASTAPTGQDEAARRGRSSLRRARGRTLFRLALLTGLIGALAVPPPLLGQNSDDIDLVSNEGPSSSHEEIKPARRTVQRFTTGPNEDGYLLSAVHLLVEKLTDHVSPVVTIHRQQRLGAPGPLVYTLENPAAFVGAAASDSGDSVDRNLVSHAFAAPEGAVLHPDTRYSLQVWSSQGRFKLSLVDVDDDFGAAGWSISNGGQRRVSGRTGANWTAAQRVQKMRITGQLNDDRVVALGIELTSAGGYQPGEAIEATVTFSDAVTVAGTPTLALQVGDHSRDAAYVSGDGTSALVFRYTVVAGDYDEDGVSILPGSLSLPTGASITEHGSTTDALLAHPDLSDQVTHKVNAGPSILPGRNGIRFTSTPVAAKDTYGLGETIKITATFSAPVFVDTTTGIPTIEMTFGTHSAGYEARAAGYVLGSGSTDLVFAYVVRSGDTDSDGVTVDADGLELNAATIQDADGLDARLAHRAFAGAGVDIGATTDVATLAGLSLSHATLTPAFAAATTSYTATVSKDIAVTTVGTSAAGDVETSIFPLDADANTAGHQVSLGDGYNVISVTVSKTGAADRTYTVTVARDGPPVFTSLPSFSVEENQVFAGEVVALDVGADDRISGYGITGGADSQVFELAPGSGTLEFANAPDGLNFEDPQDADRDNVYEMEVTATSVNQSDASEATVTQAVTVTVLDVPERPARPAAPTVEAGSATSLLVSWRAPGTNGGPDLIGYEVQYRVSGTGSWTDLPHTGTGTSATIVDALADTGYDAQVRALNGETPSEWSPTGSGPTALPGPPTNLDATASGPAAIDLSWSAPTDTGNSSITGYRIEVSSDAGANWSDLVADSGTADTAHRHTGLPASATRHYRISALNSVGEGSPSGVTDATTEMATLDLPAFDDAFDEASATVPVKVQLSHPSEVAVTVDYATSDGGGSAGASSPGDYEATSGTLTIAQPATEAEFTVAIADDTVWERTESFTVTLSNPMGAVPGVSERAVAIADDDPAPTVSFRQTQHEATEGTDAYVDLIIDMDAPAGNELTIGFDVADDTAQVSADYEPPVDDFLILAAAVQEASVRIAIIDDADVERSERFTVTLDDVDNTGIRLADAVATVTIESDDTVAPDAPTNLTASPTATDQVRLAWEAPGSDPYYGEGAEVTGYVIEVSTDGGATWTVLTANTGSIATIYTDAVTPAPAQGERSYRVSAINSAGVGPPSNEAVSGKNAATGALAITGTAQVDEALTVDTGDIRDPDGLDHVVYRYQWIRVDGGDETDIAGAVAATYTPVAADLGKPLKVRVSFTDDLGGEEELTSAATTPVAPPTPAAVIRGPAILNFPTGGIYTPGTVLDLFVEFDKAVDVTGQPRLKLALDASGAARRYLYVPYSAADSSSTELRFTLEVTGDHDDGSISRLSDSLDPNGGSIRNAGTQIDADLASRQGLIATLDTRWVEDIAVTSSPALSWSPSTYGPGETVEFTATCSEAVTLDTAGGVPRLWLEFAGGAQYAEYARGSGSNALVFAWTVPNTGFSVWASLSLQGNVTPGTSTLRTASGLDPNGAEMTDDGGRTVNVRHGDFPVPSWVDTLPPVLPGSADGATVNGFDLVLTYRVGENSADSEPLDPYSKPAPGDFSVTATGSDSVSTAHLVSRVNVAREAATVALTLADPVADGDVVTLDYTPGANPVQDLWGNAAIALAGRTVRNDTPGTVNTPASGAPTISGTTQDRHELTAATGAIMDADGLTGVSYRYQWIRVHGSSEADIADATGSTYVLTADDIGRTIRVRVTFTDDAGHVEALISTATATVTAAPPFVFALAFASTAPANGYASGDEVRISVGFNEAVTVGGAPQLSLAIGTATVAADFHGGSGSAVLTFSHTVTAADPAGASLSVPADALGLNGGTIAATATALAAVLTHDALAAESGQVIIGGSAATIESVAVTSTPAASATYGGGEEIEVTVTFSQRVEVTGTPYLQVLVGDGRGTATNFEYGGGSGTDELVFAWTVPFGASDGNGIRIDRDQLFGTIATQGTSADLDHNGQGTLSDHKIAAVPGVVTGLGATAGHGQVTLEWDRPPAAGGYDSITGYEYRIVTAGGSGAWQEVPGGDRDTVSHAVTGLDAVETTFEVRAENEAGGGPAASATATPSPPLGQVTNVVVTVGPGHGRLTVSWDPVSAADGYKVQWKSGSQSFADAPADGRERAVSGGSTTTATITGLTREEYGVRVIATRTGNVDGRPSAAHTGTPTAANTPAAGAPVITGTAQQNMTLTADTSGISDADGLSNVTYLYLWTRVDGSDESVIAGATSSTYIPVAADVDNRIKVTVSFTDDAGNAESLSSDPYPASGTIAMAPGICGRTPAVRDAILARITAVSDCADVTATHLTGITGTLRLGNPSITTLAPGDFAGLSALTTLDLFANDLTTLPAGVFAGLSALTTLDLNGNDLTTLPDRAFAELSALTTLKLPFNALTELPAEVFAGLGALTRLDLNNNALQTLPARVFRGLSSLTELYLIHNALQTLPAGVFAGLSALPTLDLSRNELETLTAEVFRGLSALTRLDLNDNELETLAAGVFTGLGALTRLDLSGNELETLAAGVFTGLGALTRLDLSGNELETLAAGVFTGLGALTRLDLNDNELETLAETVFEPLDELTRLDLEDNDLTTLPDAVFEPLTALTNLRLRDNPGAPFAPGAVALPDGGTVPDTGGSVMLDASGSGGSWGTNVTYAWALTEPASGVSVRFDDDASVTPRATVPALAADTELVFTLTVTGRGGAAGIDTASDTATVTVTRTVSDDATLRALTVNDGTGDLALVPVFSPGTLAYTAGATSTARQVTLTAATTDDGALVSAVTLDGNPIADGDFSDGITVASLQAGDNEIAVTVSAEDDTTTLTYTVTVTPAANTAPTASDGAVETDEDTAHTFAAGDFGFSDTDAGNLLASVTIVTLPAAGSGALTLGGNAVTPRQAVARDAIDGGDLTYTPPQDANGMGYASFTFTVSDGVDDSVAAYTMTVDVDAVNDPPAGAPEITGTVQVGQTLTADTSGIGDADGLTGVSYEYQWIRVHGSSETAIADAVRQTYTVAAEDAEAALKVEVTFTDDGGHVQTLASAPTEIIDSRPYVNLVQPDGFHLNTLGLGEHEATGRPVTLRVGFSAAVSGLQPNEFEIVNGMVTDAYWMDCAGRSHREHWCVVMQPAEAPGERMTLTIPEDIADEGNQAAPEVYYAVLRGTSPTGTFLTDATEPVTRVFTAEVTFDQDMLQIPPGAETLPFPEEEYLTSLDFVGATVDTISFTHAEDGSDLEVRIYPPGLLYDESFTVSLPADAALSENGYPNPALELTVEADTFTGSTLSALSLSGLEYSPALDFRTIREHAASVDNAVVTTQVTATPTVAGASVTILPLDADDATPGHQVALAVGDNTVTVEVTDAHSPDVVTGRVVNERWAQEYKVVIKRAPAVVTVAPAANVSSVAEGADAPFTLTRVGDLTRRLVVAVQVEGAAWLSPGNWPQQVIIPAGAATHEFSVQTNDDDIERDNGDLTVRVQPGSEYKVETAADGEASITITNDDLWPRFSVSVLPFEVTEAAAGTNASTVTMTVDNGILIDADQTVNLEFGGTATAGKDFTVADAGGNPLSAPYAVTLAADASAVTATITAADDTVVEQDETVEIGARVHGGAMGTPATLRILDDDANAELTLEFGAPEVDDADGTGDVTLGDVLRYEAAAVNSGNVPLTNVTVSDALTGEPRRQSCATLAIGESCEWSGSHEVTQADVDAGEVENTVTAGADEVADEQASQSTTVAQKRELTLEKTASVDSFAGVGDEIGYTYTVSNSGTVTLAGTVTIEDDKIPADGITCGAVPAGGLGPGGTVTCTGSYTTEQADVDGSEVENTASATLAGVESAEVTERVTWAGQQTGEPTVSVGGTSGPEGAGRLAFSVRLSAASEQTVKVGYATADDTATAGSDYTAVEGELTFAAGATELTIEVAIADDALDEEDESFTVTLSDAVNATLAAATATATGTITDNDDRGVTVTPARLEVDEDSSESYTVVRGGADQRADRGRDGGAVTVPAGTDVTVDPASLTFTASTWSTGSRR